MLGKLQTDQPTEATTMTAQQLLEDIECRLGCHWAWYKSDSWQPEGWLKTAIKSKRQIYENKKSAVSVQSRVTKFYRSSSLHSISNCNVAPEQMWCIICLWCTLYNTYDWWLFFLAKFWYVALCRFYKIRKKSVHASFTICIT